ncbi:MAG TPA: zf-HC2 domain-containing protein [Bryobacteraceae bacterium]|nr:zf-HC2 domain-containing protein [Bryobacteraceae bacterium]
MTCADFEVLLCDYLDGTLDVSQRQHVDAHMRECASCAAFAQDVMGAVSFVGSVERIEPPAELLTKITFHIPAEQPRGGWRSVFSGWLRPVLQPRLAMGMAMTILSFSMLARIAGLEVRQLKPSDLHPARVLAAADDRIHRTWARAVKYYENLRLVYEVQTRLHDWTEAEDQAAATDSPSSSGSKPGSEKEPK